MFCQGQSGLGMVGDDGSDMLESVRWRNAKMFENKTMPFSQRMRALQASFVEAAMVSNTMDPNEVEQGREFDDL